jgi:DnaJ-class molecular chaperone
VGGRNWARLAKLFRVVFLLFNKKTKALTNNSKQLLPLYHITIKNKKEHLLKALVNELTISSNLPDVTVLTTQGITKPKEVRKFKGEGMPLHFSTKKGDLYVAFEVLFPTSLTEDQKEKIKAVFA